MPQLEQVDTYASQIFWLALTFIPLLLLLWKVALPRVEEVLETRQRRIEDDLERARQSNEEAEQAQASYDAALAEARGRAHEVMTQASKAMAETAAGEQAALRRRLAEEERAAVAGITAAREAAMGNIRAVAIEAALLSIVQVAGAAVADGAEAELAAVVDEALG